MMTWHTMSCASSTSKVRMLTLQLLALVESCDYILE